MPGEFFTLGDVFRHKENEYVYLVGDDEITYAALICSPTHSEQLQKMFLNKNKNGALVDRINQSTTYYFVILETVEYKDRAAHFGKPENEARADVQKISRLSEEDVERLKSEILSSGAPQKLKDLISRA